MNDVVLLNINGNVADITINRPKALNALNKDVLEALYGKLKELENNKNIRVVCLSGSGDKAFVAGADIKSMSELSPQEAYELSDLGHKITALLESMSAISIACVDGFALGGGCELSLACDLVLASDKAKFGQPEVALGVIAGFGGTKRLSQIVGLRKAKELLLTGNIISAEEAQNIGLVNQVFVHDDFSDKKESFIDSILKQSPMAVAQSKKNIQEGYHLDTQAACEMEKQSFALCFKTQDQKEGMQAFIEKRKAQFNDRT